jgi:hypothetical protein
LKTWYLTLLRSCRCLRNYIHYFQLFQVLFLICNYNWISTKFHRYLFSNFY